MPLSTFDGEPSEQLQEHYDPDGRLTGSTVVTVPGWSDDDRTWALGLALRDSQRCPGCGGDLAETLDDDYHWPPQPPVVCKRCVGMNASHQARQKDPDYRSMIHIVKKVPERKRRR